MTAVETGSFIARVEIVLMARPWGTIQDPVCAEVFDWFTRGFSPDRIALLLGLSMKVVIAHIKSTPFQVDLKMMEDDEEYMDLISPMRRIQRLQNTAIDVLAEEMQPGKKNRLAAADSVLDRARDLPKTGKVINQGETIPAEAFAFMAQVAKELAGMAREEKQALDARTIDVSSGTAAERRD